MSSSGPWLRVLGPVELADHEKTDALSGRLRRLIAGLLVADGTVVSTDRLVDLLWPQRGPEDPEAALHSLVARLRSRLRTFAGDDAASGVTVLTRSPGYLVQASTGAVDASLFESLAQRGRQELSSRPDRAEELFGEALRLWRGRAYAEFADEEFARPEVTRLEELRQTVEEDRIDAALATGRHAAAGARLEVIVAREPLRERPHRQLMIAHYRCGRQADALAVARAYRERLVEELGLDPSPELQQLEAEVLRHGDALMAPAASSVRPPPGGADAPGPGRTRTGATVLVGRDQDLAELVAAVRPGRLVTLTGPGGVGKTSLARHAVAAVESAFLDGSTVIELAAVARHDDVTAALTTALRLPPRSGVDPRRQIVDHLAWRRCLLLLDNCEHVAAAVAPLLEAILPSCPGVGLLATSRAPLEVADERVWAVRPLPAPDPGVTRAATALEAASVRLFVERAGARDRAFALTDENAADIAEICRRLDGLPLAVELAAARMGAMTPADLAQRLSWRFKLLHGSSRVPERHRTLRALVDWSYELQDAPSQLVFSAVAVFAGSFTLEQADQLVAVIEDRGPPALGGAETVLSLVDRSMIAVADGGPSTRYVLLDTLRGYGRERLGASEHAVRIHRAHAEIFVGVVEEADRHLFQAGHVAAVERVATAMDELRAGWNWAVAHDLPLAVRLVAGMALYVEHRMPAEVASWADRTVRAAELHPDLQGQAKLLGVAAAGARFAGDLDRARSLLERALDLPAEPATAAYLRYILAEVSLFQGRLSEVDRLVAEVADLGPEAPVAAMVTLLTPLSRAYRGDLGDAVRLAETAYRDIRTEPDHPLTGWAAYVLAEVILDTDPDRAQDLLDEARRTARGFDDRYLAGVALVAAAAVRSRHGGTAAAVPLFLEVIEHWQVLGDWLHQWTTIRNVVDLLIRTDRREDAAVLHGALSARTAAYPIFGDDAERMAAAAGRLEKELGLDHWTALRSHGAELSDVDVLTTARAALSALAGGLTVGWQQTERPRP